MPSIFKKLLISILFGVTIFLITTVTVWRSAGASYHNNYAVQFKTISDMRSLLSALEIYRYDYGVPPPTLDIVANEIDVVTGFYRNSMEAKPGDLLVDSYGTPYQYNTTGTSYTLISLGQDKAPGGLGYNADHVYHNTELVDSEDEQNFRHEKAPTYKKFWSFKHTIRPLRICLGAGILSSLLAFYSLQSGRYFTVGRQKSIWSTLGAILIAAIIITAVLAALHVPSTH